MTQEDAITEPNKINVRDFLDSDDLLTPSEAFTIIKKALLCLIEVHSSGNLLKNLDPEKIYIHSDGSVSIDSNSLIVDFKIDDLGKTTGLVDYTSPEYLEKGTASVTSDIYSFGAMAYHLVSGKIPDLGESAMETVKNRMRSTPKPLTEKIKDFPSDLSKIIMKALDKKPENRYQSATQILVDLNNLKDFQ